MNISNYFKKLLSISLSLGLVFSGALARSGDLEGVCGPTLEQLSARESQVHLDLLEGIESHKDAFGVLQKTYGIFGTPEFSQAVSSMLKRNLIAEGDPNSKIGDDLVLLSRKALNIIGEATGAYYLQKFISLEVLKNMTRQLSLSGANTADARKSLSGFLKAFDKLSDNHKRIILDVLNSQVKLELLRIVDSNVVKILERSKPVYKTKLSTDIIVTGALSLSAMSTYLISSLGSAPLPGKGLAAVTAILAGYMGGQTLRRIWNSQTVESDKLEAAKYLSGAVVDYKTEWQKEFAHLDYASIEEAVKSQSLAMHKVTMPLTHFMELVDERCGVSLLCEMGPLQLLYLGEAESSMAEYDAQMLLSYVRGMGLNPKEIAVVKSLIHNFSPKSGSQAAQNHALDLSLHNEKKLLEIKKTFNEALAQSRLARQRLLTMVQVLESTNQNLNKMTAEFDQHYQKQATVMKNERAAVEVARQRLHLNADSLRTVIKDIDQRLIHLSTMRDLLGTLDINKTSQLSDAERLQKDAELTLILKALDEHQ